LPYLRNIEFFVAHVWAMASDQSLVCFSPIPTPDVVLMVGITSDLISPHPSSRGIAGLRVSWDWLLNPIVHWLLALLGDVAP